MQNCKLPTNFCCSFKKYQKKAREPCRMLSWIALGLCLPRPNALRNPERATTCDWLTGDMLVVTDWPKLYSKKAYHNLNNDPNYKRETRSIYKAYIISINVFTLATYLRTCANLSFPKDEWFGRSAYIWLSFHDTRLDPQPNSQTSGKKR